MALFTVTKIWKQPKCPLTDEWLKKMWYIHTIVSKLCLALSDLMDSTMPGSSVLFYLPVIAQIHVH